MKRVLLLAFLMPLVPVLSYGQSCSGSDALQKHIYHPDRLVDDKGCITVTGKIMFKKFEDDGDVHYRLKLDAGQGLGCTPFVRQEVKTLPRPVERSSCLRQDHC